MFMDVFTEKEVIRFMERCAKTYFWFPPDHMQPDSEYFTVGSDGKRYPREASFTLGSAPAQFQVGDKDDWKGNSHSVPFDERWQLFAADLFSLSKYGRLFDDLTSEERTLIAHVFTKTFDNDVCYTNNTGFGGVPRANFVARENMSAELPRWDKMRICGTNSVLADEIVTNSKGRKMIKIHSFLYDDGPPENYGIEILEDERIMAATVQYPGGKVGNFPRLLAPVYVPFVTLPDFPAYYPLDYLWEYPGPKAPVYWNEAI